MWQIGKMWKCWKSLWEWGNAVGIGRHPGSFGVRPCPSSPSSRLSRAPHVAPTPQTKLPLSPPPLPPAQPTTLARGLRSTLPARAFPVASRHSNPGNKTTTITTTTTTTHPPHSARPRLAVDPYSTHIPSACSTRCQYRTPLRP